MTTANTTKAIRVTKAMRFADLAAIINGETRPNKSTDKELLDFISHEVELLAKKNNTDNKTPTATQEANAKYRALIYDFLAVQTAPCSCTDIAKGVPELSDFNNQKVASLVKRLVDEEKVNKTSVKGRSMFAIN